jgi:hypothetical protein
LAGADDTEGLDVMGEEVAEGFGEHLGW